MEIDSSNIVRTAAGKMRGAREGGVTVFRGVPYALPPLGGRRFAAPQLPPWQGIRDATRDGPIAPQGRARLAHVMGEVSLPQGEDCLTLNVWTPGTEPAKRPVLVWLHGGAFSTGAGSLPWYSGESFAANGDLVVVSVNYRLGALGFLYLPGVSDGNLGLQDQLLALRWVRENIGGFGGDPSSVTVAGQSAGASSIAALMTMPEARGLFRRAILQSTPFGRLTRTPAEAARNGEKLVELLGKDDIRTAPAERIIAAQGALARLPKALADTNPPFGLVVDGAVVAGDIAAALAAGEGKDVAVLIGSTREEMAGFHAVDQAVQKADAEAIRGAFERVFGPDHPAFLEEYKHRHAGGNGAEILCDLFSDQAYRIGSLLFAEARAKLGRPVHVFQFDWQSPAGFKACHCLELPFVFNNFAHWTNAPMLQGADAGEVAALARAMHGAWIAFARTGDPAHEDLPDWPVYGRDDRMTMRFDNASGAVGDLAGMAGRRPWPALPHR